MRQGFGEPFRQLLQVVPEGTADGVEALLALSLVQHVEKQRQEPDFRMDSDEHGRFLDFSRHLLRISLFHLAKTRARASLASHNGLAGQ